MQGLENTDFNERFLSGVDLLNSKGIPNTVIERTLKIGRNKIANIRRGKSSADFATPTKQKPENQSFS